MNRHISFISRFERITIENTFNEVCRSIVIAKSASGAIQGFILSLGPLLSGFGSSMILVGLLGFFSTFLPVFGTSIVTLSLVVIAVYFANWTALVIYLILGLIAAVSYNIITSYLVSSDLKIHPYIIFISALAGLQVFGFYLIFVGPVLVATILKFVNAATT